MNLLLQSVEHGELDMGNEGRNENGPQSGDTCNSLIAFSRQAASLLVLVRCQHLGTESGSSRDSSRSVCRQALITDSFAELIIARSRAYQQSAKSPGGE